MAFNYKLVDDLEKPVPVEILPGFDFAEGEMFTLADSDDEEDGVVRREK